MCLLHRCYFKNYRQHQKILNENRCILKHNRKVKFVCCSYEMIDDELNITLCFFIIIIVIIIIIIYLFIDYFLCLHF